MNISYLESLLSKHQNDLAVWQADANEVIGKYGRLFNPNNLNSLTAEEFHSFLLYENNKHWFGIHRQTRLLTKDMSNLRIVLGILLDESRPLQSRLDQIFPKGKSSMMKGLGKAVATPILHVVYPDKYGVFNSKSESSLKFLELYPEIPRNSSFAEEYIAVNNVLLDLALHLGISLWQLDTLWHVVSENEKEDKEIEEREGIIDEHGVISPLLIRFSLERQLSDFLYRNWDKTELGKEYILYEESGETAQEFQTDVGRIDLLARSIDDQTWIVIELKRNRSSDEVVGQVLRYMGWVKANLADGDEKVRGLIILGEVDDRIRYALEAANADIRLYLYSIDFNLESLN